MTVFPGQNLSKEAQVISGEAGASITAGDVVGKDSSGIVLASDDGTTRVAPIGIAENDASAGDVVSVNTDGRVPANVASGTAVGVELGLSATGGQLTAVADSYFAQSLSAEGSDYGNQGVDAGFAVVQL